MYTYTLEGTTVTPPTNWQIEHRRNDGQIFFRRYLTGDIIFKDDDYDLLLEQDECTTLTFIIYCDGVEFWTGTFKYPYDFHFNTDACIAIGTPDVYDEYSCIMDKYEVEYPVEQFHADTGCDKPAQCNVTDCAGTPLAAIGVVMGGLTLGCFLDGLFQGAALSGRTYMDCTLDLASSFFWEDDFPNGDNYVAAYGTDNYVTGDTNVLQQLIFIPNTSVRQDLGGTACPEQHDTVGFKWLESVLRDRFNCYWYIDQNGDFRIEHISFFLPGFAHSDFGVGIDLTTLYEKDRSYAYRRNKYGYVTDKLFDQEKWSWQHYWGDEGGQTHGEDFQGVPIFYNALDTKSDCVPGEFKEKDVATPKLWTDCEWAVALANPDDINCNGWFMCVTDWDEDPLQNCDILCEVGLLSGGNHSNGHLSTANLMEHYFTWDRIFLDGNMNDGNVVLFDSAIRKKLQDEIEFPLCCDDDFDAMDYVTTEMGDGAVQSATQSPYSMQIQLLYD